MLRSRRRADVPVGHRGRSLSGWRRLGLDRPARACRWLVVLATFAACDDPAADSQTRASEAEPAVVERQVRGLMPAEASASGSTRASGAAAPRSGQASPSERVSEAERITPLNLEAELNKLQAEIGD
jgi:hypothetical protein